MQIILSRSPLAISTMVAAVSACFLALSSANDGADGSGGPPLPCGTVHAETFVAIDWTENGTPFPFHGMGVGVTPGDAVGNAFERLYSLMIEGSGVICAPCEIPYACESVPINLENDFQVSTIEPPSGIYGSFLADVFYSGTYDIQCTSCDS